MKTIGVIGGMSWQSTQEYYRLINEGVATKLGGFHSARMLVYSLDFADIEHFQTEGHWDKAGEALAAAAVALKEGGADILILATNTMHKVADTISLVSGLPLLHIADVVAAEIKWQGINRIGLLGTRFTMEQEFYRVRLKNKYGIETLIPVLKDRKTINNIIYQELCYGKIRDSSRSEVLEIIDRLVDDGAQGIILGCTELSLLMCSKDTDVSLLDTTALHAAAAVEMALSG